jgi:hypothetical protein
MPIPFVIVIVIAVVGLFIWQRMRLKESLAQNQDKNFGAVADRLGMRVEEGDPNTNLLFFMEKRGNYERSLRASGQPYAHPASFAVMDGVKTNEYLVYRRITHSFGCYLDAKLKQSIPPFEVVLRHPNQYLIPNQDFGARTELLETPTKNAALDAQFVIRSAEPRIASLLAPALQVIAQQPFVHLAGEGNQLWINFPRMALPYFASAAEEYLLLLETAACAIDGLPLPARLSASTASTRALPQ